MIYAKPKNQQLEKKTKHGLKNILELYFTILRTKIVSLDVDKQTCLHETRLIVTLHKSTRDTWLRKNKQQHNVREYNLSTYGLQ